MFGGMLTTCRALLQSSLPTRVSLDVLDSTQITVPPPRLPTRVGLALKPIGKYPTGKGANWIEIVAFE